MALPLERQELVIAAWHRDPYAHAKYIAARTGVCSGPIAAGLYPFKRYGENFRMNQAMHAIEVYGNTHNTNEIHHKTGISRGTLDTARTKLAKVTPFPQPVGGKQATASFKDAIPDDIREATYGKAKPVEKHDSEKLPYELIAPEFLDAVAAVLKFGAIKYEPRGWEKGTAWGRYFGAAMRHLWAWWRGEQFDEESGLSHLAHAACCVMFLVTYEARKVGEDDRHGE